jgi:hypothetical protein
MRSGRDFGYARDSRAYRHGVAYLKTLSTLRGAEKGEPKGGFVMRTEARNRASDQARCMTARHMAISLVVVFT